MQCLLNRSGLKVYSDLCRSKFWIRAILQCMRLNDGASYLFAADFPLGVSGQRIERRKEPGTFVFRHRLKKL